MCVCYNSDREAGAGADPLSTRNKLSATSGSTTLHQCAKTLHISRPFEAVTAVYRAARRHALNSRSACIARRGMPNQVSLARARARRAHVSRLLARAFAVL